MDSIARFATPEARWQAVVRRDPAADGAFFYSVRTTGVYCRPSCAARLPRRENVAFHDDRASAERAGFRPCKRCRPERDASAHAETVAKACRLIEDSEELPSLGALAAEAGLSRFHFHRVFKASTGLTPKAYGAAHQARRVQERLGESQTVTEAIYDAGYNSSSRFYEAAPRRLGMTPQRYRAGGKDMVIRFAVGQCSLGAILVAATERGICAIMLDREPETLVRALEDRFPSAELVGGDAAFESWVAKVVGFVEAPRLGLDLPLDLRGTAFQERVWRALQEIPPGKTATYSEIAARLGRPDAVRAVAHACAQNPIAVAIPCHRVVRRDGGLAGYRWGIERKRALLEREARP
jgi:AraC family transcriptional regulator, regulatory protein of adaptative response / methylated-DNA-[protein]-cysteine methyltransferase